MPSLPLSQGKPLDVPRTVHQALELHRQGRIADAERLYASVLAVRPDNIDALQMLDRKSTRLNSSHSQQSRMPSSA